VDVSFMIAREHRMIQKSLRILTHILVAIGMASLIGIVLVIVVNVIARKVFNSPILWSLEMCSILVVWSTYILFGVDYQENKHFRITVLTMLLSKRANEILEIIVNFILFVGVIVLAVSTWNAIQMNGRMILTAMPIPLVLAFYLPFTIGIISHFLYLVVRIYATLATQTPTVDAPKETAV